MAAEKPVCLGTIIELIIVRSRVAVLVPAQQILFAVKGEYRLDGIEDERLGHGGSKAAVILGVISQQSGPRRHEGGQIREVDAVKHIRGRLLEVAEITVFFGLDTTDDR